MQQCDWGQQGEGTVLDMGEQEVHEGQPGAPREHVGEEGGQQGPSQQSRRHLWFEGVQVGVQWGVVQAQEGVQAVSDVHGGVGMSGHPGMPPPHQQRHDGLGGGNLQRG